MKWLYFAKASAKCSIFLSGLAFDVEPYNNFCERCHLDTNYVVTAAITLQEGGNLPLSALERHANQVKRVTALLLCLKNMGWTCLQFSASNSSISFSWDFCTWWGSCYLCFKEAFSFQRTTQPVLYTERYIKWEQYQDLFILSLGIQCFWKWVWGSQPDFVILWQVVGPRIGNE